MHKYQEASWNVKNKHSNVDEKIHNTGGWKKYENRLRGVDFHLALPHEVDTIVYNLFMNWKESEKTNKNIADFHYRFERIHLFQDGNATQRYQVNMA